MSIPDDLLVEFEPKLMPHTVSILGSQLINVNAFCLATKSGLFYRLYAERQRDKNPLILTQEEMGSSEGLKIILYFCHFDKLPDPNSRNLRDALTAAVHFESKKLEHFVTDFVTAQMSLETGNRIWKQVRVFPDLAVTKWARDFVLKHFLTLAEREDYREFDVDTVLDLVRDDWLNAWQEDLLVEPVLHWLRDRVTPIWDQICLLASIRFDLLSQAGRAALTHTEGFQYFGDFRRSPMFAGLCAPNEPRRSHEGVLHLGDNSAFGYGGNNQTSYYLDPRTGNWAQLAPQFSFRDPRSGFACAALDGCRVVVAGGRKGSSGAQELKHTVECLCLDLRRDAPAWEPLAALHEARSGLSAVVHDSVLYVIGGEDSSGGCLDTVESLEWCGGGVGGGGLTRWRLRAPLPEGRSWAGVASVGGRIVACGGYVISQFQRLPCEQVASYDPATDQWTGLAYMTYPRAGASVLALQPDGMNPQLLVVGGNSAAPAERLQLFTPGDRHARWVAAGAAPTVKFEATVSCQVDSRWLIAKRTKDAPDSSSVEVPINQLHGTAKPSEPNTFQTRQSSEFFGWFGGLTCFNVVTVGGREVIEKLLKGARKFNFEDQMMEY